MITGIYNPPRRSQTRYYYDEIAEPLRRVHDQLRFRD